MKLATGLLCAFALLAQEKIEFRTNVHRWTNHDFPAILKPYMPMVNESDKRDGIMVTVASNNESVRADALKLTLNYIDAEGQRKTAVQFVDFNSIGCTPRPCRTAAAIFVVGVVDVSAASVEIERAVVYTKEQDHARQ